MFLHAGISLREQLGYIAFLIELTAIARLVYVDRFQRLRWFTCVLALDWIGTLTGIAFSPDSEIYRTAWLWRQPLTIALYVMAAWEVLDGLTAAYPRFERKRRELAIVAAVVAIVAGFWFIEPDLFGAKWVMPWLQGMFVVRRFEAIAALGWLGVINLAFIFSPAAARPNAVRHARIFMAFVAADAVGYAAMSHMRSLPVQLSLITAQMVCFIAWTIAVTAKGQLLEGVAVPAATQMARRAEAGFAMSLFRAE